MRCDTKDLPWFRLGIFGRDQYDPFGYDVCFEYSAEFHGFHTDCPLNWRDVFLVHEFEPISEGGRIRIDRDRFCGFIGVWTDLGGGYHVVENSTESIQQEFYEVTNLNALK